MIRLSLLCYLADEIEIAKGHKATAIRVQNICIEKDDKICKQQIEINCLRRKIDDFKTSQDESTKMGKQK